LYKSMDDFEDMPFETKAGRDRLPAYTMALFVCSKWLSNPNIFNIII